MPKEKIAYLFGAGATCAEVSHTLDEDNKDKVGLSIGDVTRRVMLKAKANKAILKSHKYLFDRAADITNIELLLTLLESNQYDIENYGQVVESLRDWVEKDISSVLRKKPHAKFILHKAFFELHKHNKSEVMIGIISLNYDTLLDRAYKEFYNTPNYCLEYPTDTTKTIKPPLLKLHGSFSWNPIKLYGKTKKIPIIPLGINKNYLRLPYSHIWGRALEVLVDCDKLRVIGCSLSLTDIHLVDMILKAHLLRGSAFEIEIISSDKTGDDIRNRYAFFPKITVASKIETTLMREVKQGSNVFMEWLKAKGVQVFVEKGRLKKTKYLRHIIL